MKLSMLRWAVLYNLAKAWKLNLDVPISRVVKVFNLNSKLTYKFLNELKSEGIVEVTGKGRWRLKSTPKARYLAEYVLSTVTDSPYKYWVENVPEVYYYVAEPPSIEWLGYPKETLVIVDNVLRDKINPPSGYKVVYVSMRGRKWIYDRDMQVSRATTEQALADLLSYDTNYPVEQYIYYNIDRLNLDDIAQRANLRGLRRLATFLAFYRTATGREVLTRINYFGLMDAALLNEMLADYVNLVFANGIAEARGI